jgi:hypothetical protein
MSVVTIVIALVGIVIAWKVLAGMVKLGVIAVIAVVALYFLSQGTV